MPIEQNYQTIHVEDEQIAFQSNRLRFSLTEAVVLSVNIISNDLGDMK